MNKEDNPKRAELLVSFMEAMLRCFENEVDLSGRTRKEVVKGQMPSIVGMMENFAMLWAGGDSIEFLKALVLKMWTTVVEDDEVVDYIDGNLRDSFSTEVNKKAEKVVAQTMAFDLLMKKFMGEE